MVEQPGGGERQQLLRDGFWEETAVYRRDDGVCVVRKNSKAQGTAPWALHTLRREIDYLHSLPEAARPFFPPLLNAWGMEEGSTATGYEIPFYDGWVDGTKWLATDPDPGAAELLQKRLGEVVFTRLHLPVQPRVRLGRHVEETIREAVTILADSEGFRSLTGCASLFLNAERLAGFPPLLDSLSRSGLYARLDCPPQRRLHGDLILENILMRSGKSIPRLEDLKLIDPVSVAGISEGTPLFDLVKYETYATGHLLALRSGWLDCSMRTTASGTLECRCEIDAGHPGLRPFRRVDMVTVFRQQFERHYGPIDESLYHLLDAYFSLVMALNTSGDQKRARVFQALVALNTCLFKTQ